MHDPRKTVEFASPHFLERSIDPPVDTSIAGRLVACEEFIANVLREHRHDNHVNANRIHALTKRVHFLEAEVLGRTQDDPPDPEPAG